MDVPTKTVEPYTTFLVVAPRPPQLYGIAPEAVTYLDPATSNRRLAGGALVRQSIKTSPADLIVIVDDPSVLTVGWLGAAAGSMGDAAAVVVGADEAYRDSVAPIGAAAVFRADVLREIGGFQEAFDSSVAALDALWRLQTRGLHVRTLSGYTSKEAQFRVRPSDLLAVAVSNLEQASADRLLAELTLQLITNPLRTHGVDTTALDLERSPGGDDVGHLEVPVGALSGLDEIDRTLSLMAGVGESRRIAAAIRRLSDRFLRNGINTFMRQAAQLIGADGPLLNARLFAELDASPIKVVVVSQGKLDERTKSLWLRLGERFAVRWASVDDDQVSEVVNGAWQKTDEKIITQRDWADAVVLKDVLVRSVPWLAGRPLPVLVDATDWHFGELLEAEYPGMMGRSDNRGVLTVLVGETLERADHVLTRDLDHRDRILGWMAGLGRISPIVYDQDHSLQNLVALPTSDLEASIVKWCQRPRRAADLVHSYPSSASEKKKLNVLSGVSKIWSRKS